MLHSCCFAATLTLLASGSLAVEPTVAATAPAAATFRGGSLSREQVDAWLQHRPPSRRLDPAAARRQRIEERALLTALEQRFTALQLGDDPDAAGWQRLLERRLAAAALRAGVSAETLVPETEVETAYQADPRRFDQPQRWRLLNLFKRFPPASKEPEREELRARMAALRAQLVARADFADLARRESDSTTRERGGALGSASLAELHPVIAQVVTTLGPGDLSPIIETADGLTLLRCEGIVPAVALTADETRERLRSTLRSERVERAWEELTDRLLEAAAPDYHLDPLVGGMESAVVTLRAGDNAVSSLDRRDLELYLRDQRVPPANTLDGETLRHHAEQLVLQHLRAQEAIRRGLTATSEHRERLEIETLAMRGELALDPEIERRLRPPKDEEVAALYARRREQLVEPAQRHVRTLEIPLRADLPAGFYRQAEELGASLASGDLGLEAARDALAPHARLRDRGWLGPREAFLLGRTAEAALDQLAPSGVSRLVQEGRTLLFVELVSRRPDRQLSLDEARPQLVSALIAAQRERIRTELRAELLAQLEIEIAP